jgi:hypothetical protein
MTLDSDGHCGYVLNSWGRTWLVREQKQRHKECNLNSLFLFCVSSDGEIHSLGMMRARIPPTQT